MLLRRKLGVPQRDEVFINKVPKSGCASLVEDVLSANSSKMAYAPVVLFKV